MMGVLKGVVGWLFSVTGGAATFVYVFTAAVQRTWFPMVFGYAWYFVAAFGLCLLLTGSVMEDSARKIRRLS